MLQEIRTMESQLRRTHAMGILPGIGQDVSLLDLSKEYGCIFQCPDSREEEQEEDRLVCLTETMSW